jgi:hypothetical protein
LFTTSDLYSYVTRQVAAGGTPFFQPMLAFPGYPPQNALLSGADDGWDGFAKKPSWSRFTGTMLPGQVAWFTDDNIPASGSNTQLFLLSPEEAIVLFEQQQPTLNVFPQTVANNLEIVLTVRKYCAFLARHTAGIQIIVGAAYPTSAK